MAEKETKPFDAASKSVDPVTVEMLKKAEAEGIETIWHRAEKMKACPIGAEGSCCRICSQGPCRVPKPKKEGEDTKGRMGLCGATAETIVGPELRPYGGRRRRGPQRPFPGHGPAVQGSGPRQGPGLPD